MTNIKTPKASGIKKLHKTGVFEIIFLIVLALYALSMIYLIIWGLITSLKPQLQFRENYFGLPKGLPWKWEWQNYMFVYQNFRVDIPQTTGIKHVNFLGLIINTFLYAGVGAFLQAIVPCVVGYITCKYNYKICKVIYVTVIVTMIIPIVGAFPSEIQLLKSLNLFDSFIGNWIQKFNFMGVYYLVFYASFKSVPQDFSDAARIDGASELRVMTVIMLPLVKTAIFTVMLIRFIEFWNDYQAPLLYLPSHPTLAYGVFMLSTSRKPEFNNIPMRMAGCMFLLIPILIMFIALKEKLMGNISMGGIKE